MEIRNSAPLSSVAATAASPQQIASLKLGAILEVVVQARMGDNRFQLQQLSGGESLTAMSQAELAIGQRLQVQVTRLGTLPELRILSAPLSAPEVVPNALRELLPKQIDLKEFAAMLGRLPLSGSSDLPEPVRLAVERLVAAMPQAEKLMTPEGLQKAVRNSGLFLEASLGAVLTHGAPLPDNDMKARLLSLLSVLQEEGSGKPVADTKIQKQEIIQPVVQIEPSQPAKQVLQDTGEQAMPNPDKAVESPENQLPKITGEPVHGEGSEQDKTAPQFPVVRNTGLAPADKLQNEVIEQALSEPEAPASKTDQTSAKTVAQPSANPADLQVAEEERSAAAPKSQPSETILLAVRNALPLPSTEKAEANFSKLEWLDLEKVAQKAEGALAKITVDQLASQPRDNGAVSLQVTVPFIHENYQDDAKLKFTSEGASADEERIEPVWTATIQLHPPGLGIFNARVIWNGTQINTCLWSQQEETADRIGQATEMLRARLEQAGLAVGALTVLDRPPSSPPMATDISHLLDLRA